MLSHTHKLVQSTANCIGSEFGSFIPSTKRAKLYAMAVDAFSTNGLSATPVVGEDPAALDA